MAFFGLEQNDMLERDKQRFLQQQQHGGGNGGHSGNSGGPGGPSDMAVYTWGEDGYDGLGDALQERGDDFNDETFGTSGPVGRDFDFAGQTANLSLEDSGIPSAQGQRATPSYPPDPAIEAYSRVPVDQSSRMYQASPNVHARSGPQSAISSKWDDTSTFSILGGMDSGNRGNMARSGNSLAQAGLSPAQSMYPSSQSGYPSSSASTASHSQSHAPSHSQSQFSPFDAPLDESAAFDAYDRSPAMRSGGMSGMNTMHSGRSVHEIEEEMRLQAQRQRLIATQRAQQPSPHSQQRLYQMQQQQQQQQQMHASPHLHHNLRAQSPLAGSNYLQHQHQLESARVPSPLTRQELLYQQQQQQQQLQQLQQQQLLQEQQARLTAAPNAGVTGPPQPPRMHPHSGSPRFHQMQQEIQINRQQEQYKLQWLNKQLQREEQLRTGSVGPGPGPGYGEYQGHPVTMQGGAPLTIQSPLDEDRRRLEQLTAMEYAANGRRQGAGPNAGPEVVQRQPHVQPHPPPSVELRVAAELAQLRRHSPAVDPHLQTAHMQTGQPQLSDNIQMQQLLLHRQAKEKFMRDMVGHEQVGQRILEAERMEEKRRIKAGKMSHMARYNDLMTQSDKDFITRIQVSQLVTQDPYAEDFYAQIYVAIMRAKLGLPEADPRVINFASGGGVGVGVTNRPNGRRAGAIAKMEAQVEKIVQAAKQRDKDKGINATHSLQGALGKTAGRSYKAAPRQLLQVGGGEEGDGTNKDARTGLQALNETIGSATEREPMTRREALLTLERLFDLVGEIETMDRRPPPPENVEATDRWSTARAQFVDQMWLQLHTNVPIYACKPHPLVSLLMPAKGKRFLARLTKYLDGERALVILTLIVALFPSMDVVERAPLLDSLEPSDARAEVEAQTQTWLDSVPTFITAAVTYASFTQLVGWVDYLLRNTIVVQVASTRPGLTLLMYFMSRADTIKREYAAEGIPVEGEGMPDDLQAWEATYHEFFNVLAPNFLYLFPSYRITGDTAYTAALPADVDSRAWQFLAVFATLAHHDARPALVTGLRDKILADLAATRVDWVPDEGERTARLANLNLFLNSLGLDSSQIAM